MIIRFNRRRVETICIALSFGLILFLAFFLILFMVDEVLNWDLFPDDVQNTLGAIAGTAGIILGACFLIVLMVNMSLTSLSLERLAGALEKRNETPGTDGK